MGMIYGNSTDPVLIKKISLRIWTLRDEIEAVIARRVEQIKNSNSPEAKLSISELRHKVALEELAKEYTTTHVPVINNIQSGAQLKIVSDSPAGEESTQAASQDPASSEATTPEGQPEGQEDQANQDESTQEAAAENKPPEEAATEEAPSESATEGTASEGPSNGDILLQEAQKADETQGDATAQQDGSSDGDLGTMLTQEEGQNIVLQRRPLLSESQTVNGRMVLSEIGIEKLYCFCDTPFMEGQSILIEFLLPKRFIMSAQVIYCRNFTLKGRIIRETKLVFRLMAKFTFERPGERTLLRQFLASITPDIPVPAPKAKPASAEAELDDLGDLDL